MVQRGTILLGDIFENIDHPKFFIIMGEDEHCVVGFFFINSRIHASLFNKPQQLELQYPLRKQSYAFLHHDSFVSASTIIKITKETLVSHISEKRVQYIDNLHQDDIKQILEAVNNSNLFSKKDKQRYFS